MRQTLGILCLGWCVVSQAADRLTDAQRDLQQNQTARTELQADIEQGSKNARLVDAALGQIAEELKGARQALRSARDNVTQTEAALATQQAAVAQAEAQLTSLMHRYRDELRAYYLTGIPLTNQPPSIADERAAAYLPFVLEALQTRAQAIATQSNVLRREEKAQADAFQQAKSALQRAEQADQTLRLKQRENTALLAQLKRDISTQQARIAALDADQQRLQALIQELRAIPIGSTLAPYKGRLVWPVDGIISHRFGAPRSDGFGTWQGLVISARDALQVRAVQGGQVAYAGYLLGYGLVVVLGHADGYATIYGHNQQLLVKTGDTVTNGSPIAIAGNTGSLNSTGVYFALTRQGRPENPEPWLQ